MSRIEEYGMRIERFQQAGQRSCVKNLLRVYRVGRIFFHDGEGVDDRLYLLCEIVSGRAGDSGA